VSARHDQNAEWSKIEYRRISISGTKKSTDKEKSSQIAWKIVPLGHFFPLKVVPLIKVLLYFHYCGRIPGSSVPALLGSQSKIYHLHVA
jgi:hypothetical protein